MAPNPPPFTLVVLGPEHPDLTALLEGARARGVLMAHTHCLPQALRWLETLSPDGLVCPPGLTAMTASRSWTWDGSPSQLAAIVDELRPPPRTELLRCGPLRALQTERKVYLAHQPHAAIELPEVEWRLLVCLMQRQGRVATRRDLLNEAWPAQAAPKSRSVDQVVSRLRRQLAPLGVEGQLRSLRGLGYRLDPAPLSEGSITPAA